jgi:hypothetical protein
LISFIETRTTAMNFGIAMTSESADERTLSFATVFAALGPVSGSPTP